MTNKHPATLKLCGTAIACLFALSACDKKNDVPTNGEQSVVTPVASTEQAVLSCDSASVKNSLVQALSERTHQTVHGLMGGFANSSAIDLPRLTQARLGELSLDFQNIHQNGSVCIADMVITLPSEDVAYAYRYYAQTDTDLDTLVAQKSLSLDGTTLTSPIRYGVANGQANLLEHPQALDLVAQMMSASAYLRTQGAGRVNLEVRRPITVAPLPATPATPSPNDASNSTRQVVEPPISDTTPTLQDNSTTTITDIPVAPTAKPTSKPAAQNKNTAPSGEHELVVIEGEDTY